MKPTGCFQLLLLLLVAAGSAAAQSASAVFLQKDSTPANGYHAVYIEHDTASQSYNYLPFSQQSIQEAENQLRALHPGPGPQPLKLPAALPVDWLPLYRYRDSYYVYRACDGIWRPGVHLSDHSILQLREPCSEGWGYYLHSLSQSGAGRFLLSYGTSSDSGSLTIVMIDARRHVAVFRYNCAGGKCEDYLMVDAACVRRFPIVVNDCRDSKWVEFQFDPVDFKALPR